MKTIFRNTALRLMAVLVALVMSLTVNAQANVTRGGKKKQPTAQTQGTTGNTGKNRGTATQRGQRNQRGGTSRGRTGQSQRRHTGTTTRTTPTPTVEDEDDDDPNILSYETSGGYQLLGRVLQDEDFTDNADAQPSIREALGEEDNPTNGYLTDNAALYIKDDNGYNCKGIPSDMLDALRYCNKNAYKINDICLTNNGYWCVIYEGNKFKGSLPTACRNKLNDLVSQGEQLWSVSISDNGDYAFVTDNKYGASNDLDRKIMELAQDSYGELMSVCITNVGVIATCKEGAMFYNIPHTIPERLAASVKGTPKVIRFTDSGTYMCITTGGGSHTYM